MTNPASSSESAFMRVVMWRESGQCPAGSMMVGYGPWSGDVDHYARRVLSDIPLADVRLDQPYSQKVTPLSMHRVLQWSLIART